MNQKKIIIAILAVLLVLTAVLAIIHLTDRDSVPEGAVAVDCQGHRVYLEKSVLEKEQVTGTLVNGKGQEIPVDAVGVSLADALVSLEIAPESISALRITAQDEFSAEVSAAELLEPGKVFLISEDSSISLVVFGDSNAKRNVKNVAIIEVIC